MEEIEINGKKYVLKEDTAKSKFCEWVTPEFYMTDSKISGIGTMKLTEGYVLSRFDIDRLTELLNMMKRFESESHPSCDIAIKNGSPIAIGIVSGDKQYISGFMLAPTINAEAPTKKQ